MTVGSGITRLVRSREAVILAAAVFLAIATSIKTPSFIFGPDGWRELLLGPAILLLLAIGQSIVVITRNIDLSVGSILGLTAYLAGSILRDFPGIPILAVMFVCVVAGALLGLINALLVAVVGLPSLVVTLGTLYVYRGIDVLWAGGTRIFPADLPADLLNLGTASVASLPVISIVSVAILIAVGWYLKNTRSGREFYAVGSSPVAAALQGIRSARRIFEAFVMSGALAGLAGALYLARYATADSQVGKGWELQAVAAVVIGGVAIFGGSGNVWGAAAGTLLLVTISRALPVLGVPDLWQQGTVGVLILTAIVVDRVFHLRQLASLRSGGGERVER